MQRVCISVLHINIFQYQRGNDNEREKEEGKERENEKKGKSLKEGRKERRNKEKKEGREGMTSISIHIAANDKILFYFMTE